MSVGRRDERRRNLGLRTGVVTDGLTGLSSVRALFELLVELEEAIHGDDEHVREVVRDRLVEVLELVRTPVDSRDVGRQGQERNRLDELEGSQTRESLSVGAGE